MSRFDTESDFEIFYTESIEMFEASTAPKAAQRGVSKHIIIKHVEQA